MEKKKLILLGGLVVVAVVGFLQLQKMTAPNPQSLQETTAPVAKVVSTVEYVDVLVANKDILLGTRIRPDLIKWKRWPAEALNPNLIDNDSRPQAMEEMTSAVARATIFAGEPISERKVVQAGDRGQMAALLKPGMRAISTRISVDSAAGGFIQPGDRVDVVLTTELRANLQQQGGGGAQNNYIATTIMENVHVLAIGQTFGDTENGEAYVIGSTALLELSQPDAEVLIEAQSKGDVSLTLRGLNTGRAGFVPSATTSARKQAGGVRTMTIYRNGQPQQVAIQGP